MIKVKKFAAVDIGSNAVRMLVSNVLFIGNNEPRFKKLSLIRVPIRLGEDVFKDGEITSKKADLLAKAMQGFKALADAYEVEDIRAFATSAMREATNSEAVIAQAKAASDLDIEIISGKREAELIMSSFSGVLLAMDCPYLYLDVGGGSSELTLYVSGRPVASKSFNIGTVRMLNGSVGKSHFEEVEEWVKKHTKQFKPGYIIGSGGNINKLIKIIEGKKGDKIIKSKQLEEVYDDLKSMSVEERVNAYDLRPDRADVIVPAAKIFLKVLDWSDCKKVFVPKVGLADGMTKLMFEASLKQKA